MVPRILVMTVGILLQEELLKDNIACKCHNGNGETRESAFHSIPSGEGTGVPPCLAAAVLSLDGWYSVAAMLTFWPMDLLTAILCLLQHR